VLEALALAFGLAMDATAVAAARGLVRHRKEAVLIPLLFGLFQAGMAALGWGLGAWGGDYVVAWDHWIAFGLLVAIGGKMLYEAIRGDGDDDPDPGTVGLYVVLAFATSIDAAAAGLTLPLLDVAPGLAIALIGVVTLACAAVGYALGKLVGHRFGSAVEILGGLILIGIGVRVLVEHL